MNADYPLARDLFAEIWRALGGDELWLDRVRFPGDSARPSPVAATDVAAANGASAVASRENSWGSRARRPP